MRVVDATVSSTPQPSFRLFLPPIASPIALTVAPRLLSWDHKDHPSQTRLTTFLDHLESQLRGAGMPAEPLSLKLNVALAPGADLFSSGDLDNYLIPVALRLGGGRIVSAWATKFHGSESTIQIETARPAGLSRQWNNVWKQSIDALGPIIGLTTPSNPWMWYVFPQFDGLGFSATSKRYSIKTLAEAYLSHPVLGCRLTACVEAALGIEGRSALEIFGTPDDMKLKSCATLFASVSPAGSVFDRLLDKYFEGERDERTLRLLGGR